MAACRRIACFAKRNRIYIFKHDAFYSTSTQLKPETATNEIVIPYRIERGPTDILKALASTIHKDHTASHYKYEDDPYFIPSSNIGKRTFALAKESGRKAARYFLENYPEVFKCNKSIPHIKAFDPPVIYTEENVTSVEALQDCINDCNVENSINVYNILKEKGIAVSQEMKQDLLELICFYNCKQPIGEEFYEERFFKLNIKQDKRRENKWNAKGMAEQLFNEMEKDNRAYSVMIAGASKFYDEERALALYEEMRQKGLPGTKEAYNSLISVCYLFKEGHESRWEFAYQLLHTMNENRLTPDINTMNAVLELLTHCFKWKKSMQLALRLLAEMRKLKIEPSLGSYYYMLLLFCNQNLQNADILYEFMSQIEGKEFEIKHPADIEFFSTAIELCMKGTGDKELGYRIHNLLEFKNNSKFLGNSLLESRYFKNFFKLLCKTEDVDKLMEFYNKYVPNTYIPEPSVMLNIIEAIHLSGSYTYLPKMCSDVSFFEQSERPDILSTLVEAAGCMKHDPKIQTDLINMVWNLYEKINVRLLRRSLFQWAGAVLADILKTFLNGGDLEKAWAVVKQLKDDELRITGYPDIKCLLKFCELCLEKEDYEKLTFCIKYAVKSTYPNFRGDAKTLADGMFEEGKISEKQRPQVDAIFHSYSSLDEDSESSSSSSDDDSSSSDDEETDKQNLK